MIHRCSSSKSVSKPPPKSRKNKARREHQKLQLQKAEQLVQSPKKPDAPKKVARDERVPAKEWQQITSFKYSGPRRRPFFNCSLDCCFGDQCKMKYSCVECGTTLGTATTDQLPWRQGRCWPAPLAFGNLRSQNTMKIRRVTGLI